MTVPKFLWLLPAVLAFGGCSLSFDRLALPFDTGAVQLGVGVQPLPIREGWTLFRIAPLWWDNDRVFLLSLCGVNVMKSATLNLSGLTAAESGTGISVSLLADRNDHHTGIRLAPITLGRQDGIQFGLFNFATPDSHALQIGLMNYNGNSFLPFINGVWGTEETPDQSQSRHDVSGEETL